MRRSAGSRSPENLIFVTTLRIPIFTGLWVSEVIDVLMTKVKRVMKMINRQLAISNRKTSAKQ
jgi:hypothetical protein